MQDKYSKLLIANEEKRGRVLDRELDPTSPMSLVAKSNLEMMDKQSEQIKLANITNIVNIVCHLLSVVLLAIITMAVVVMSGK